MSLNAYKISLKFYTSYLNNKLQQIIHSYIRLLKYHRKILRNLAGSPSTKSLLSQTPPFCLRHMTKQFLWLSTSTVTPLLNFSMLFLLRNSKVRAILRNPPNTATNWYRFRVQPVRKLRSKINTFWSAFFTAKIQIWQKYLNRLAITLPSSHTIYICCT